MLPHLARALLALALLAPPAHALDAHRIAVKNACSTRLRVALHHMGMDGAWITNGWFGIAPGDTKALAPTPHDHFYVTGEAVGRVWAGEDALHTVRDDPVPYGFRRVDIPGGGFVDHVVTLGCEETFDIAPLHYIQVVNRCARPVSLTLHYRDLDGEMRTQGEMRLDAGRRAHLARTPADRFYLRARAEGIEWSGDHPVEMPGGETLGFLTAHSARIKTLTCE